MKGDRHRPAPPRCPIGNDAVPRCGRQYERLPIGQEGLASASFWGVPGTLRVLPSG